MKVNKLIASAVIVAMFSLQGWILSEIVSLKVAQAACLQELHDHLGTHQHVAAK